MTGRLIAVVGASGVGKDSVIDALVAARPGLLRVRRTITRPPGPGESFESVDPAAFARMRDAGAFCLAWEAHGLSYGIPVGVEALVRGGGEAIANLSRGALPEAERMFVRLVVLHLTASPATLADRLEARGRDDGPAIRARLVRAGEGLPAGLRARVVAIANDGPLARTVAGAVTALYDEGAP